MQVQELHLMPSTSTPCDKVFKASQKVLRPFYGTKMDITNQSA